MNDSVVVACATDCVQPLNANVLVRPDPVDKRTAGGIYIPDSAKTRTQRGTIIAVGPDVQHLQVGQRVLFTFWSAIHLDLNGVEHFLYAAKDILAVMTQEAPRT